MAKNPIAVLNPAFNDSAMGHVGKPVWAKASWRGALCFINSTMRSGKLDNISLITLQFEIAVLSILVRLPYAPKSTVYLAKLRPIRENIPWDLFSKIVLKEFGEGIFKLYAEIYAVFYWLHFSKDFKKKCLEDDSIANYMSMNVEELETLLKQPERSKKTVLRYLTKAHNLNADIFKEIIIPWAIIFLLLLILYGILTSDTGPPLE